MHEPSACRHRRIPWHGALCCTPMGETAGYQGLSHAPAGYGVVFMASRPAIHGSSGQPSRWARFSCSCSYTAYACCGTRSCCKRRSDGARLEQPRPLRPAFLDGGRSAGCSEAPHSRAWAPRRRADHWRVQRVDTSLRVGSNLPARETIRHPGVIDGPHIGAAWLLGDHAT